jgi:hypothetical protein
LLFPSAARWRAAITALKPEHPPAQIIVGQFPGFAESTP